MADWLDYAEFSETIKESARADEAKASNDGAFYGLGGARKSKKSNRRCRRSRCGSMIRMARTVRTILGARRGASSSWSCGSPTWRRAWFGPRPGNAGAAIRVTLALRWPGPSQLGNPLCSKPMRSTNGGVVGSFPILGSRVSCGARMANKQRCQVTATRAAAAWAEAPPVLKHKCDQSRLADARSADALSVSLRRVQTPTFKARP